MSLLDRIKADLLAYRRNKKVVLEKGTPAEKQDNATTIVVLTTFVGDIETAMKKPGARIDDSSIVALAKARISSINECVAHLGQDMAVAAKQTLLEEVEVYKRYIPIQFTDGQIETGILLFLKAEPGATLGQIQGLFKKNHSGLYDGKKVSEIFNKITKDGNSPK